MLILASNSPRRKELLAGLGVPFKVLVIHGIDESYPDTLPANEVAEFISRKKAEAYKNAFANGAVGAHVTDKFNSVMTGMSDTVKADKAEPVTLLTADTVVVCEGEILGKPTDEADAHRMLSKLSGKTHQVYTGYCLLHDGEMTSGSVCTDVTFKTLSDEEIWHYIREFHPMDKAGAYGIQEWIGYIGITGIQGSYYNVMGLPVQRIYEELRKLGN